MDDGLAEFEEFVSARSAALRRLTWALAGDQHLGEDVAQESLRRLWRRWQTVSAAGDAWPYLQRIAVSVASTWRVRHRPASLDLFSHDAASAGEPATDSVDSRDQIERWLRQLPPRQRAVIVLRFLSDLSVEETSAVLNCAGGTVKSQTAKALNSLRGMHDRETQMHR